MIKQTVKTSCLLFICLFVINFSTYAVKPNPPANDQAVELNKKTLLQELEKAKGEKLNFVEKIFAKSAIRKARKKGKLNNAGSDGEEKKGMAIAAMVLGISSLLGLAVPFLGLVAIPAAITAVVFGAISLKRVKQEPGIYGGKGMALTGMICGIVFLTLLLLAVIFIASIL